MDQCLASFGEGEVPLLRKMHQAGLRTLAADQPAVVACACRQGRAVAPEGRVVEGQVSAFPCAGQVTRGAPSRPRQLDGDRVLVRPALLPRARAWGLKACLLPADFRP